LIELIALLAIAAAIYIGWNLGSNTAASCIGTAVGGGIITLKRALILVGIFALLGAVIGGGQVIQTYKEFMPSGSITPLIALIVCLSAGVFVMVCTFLKFPVSVTHATIGAILGIGFALSVSINWGTIGKIGIVWITTAPLALLFGFVIYKYFNKGMRRVKNPATANLILKVAVIASGCYVAYGLGANNIGNVAGLIAGANVVTPFIAAAIGGLAILVGVVTWGGGIVETVGKGMTEIDPAMAFAAQLSAALVMNIFAMVGMPTSVAHAVIGAVIGVGFVKGTSAVNMKLARNIFLAWILTPIVAALIAFGAFKIIGLF
jgi:phosphate/sulfate permease